MGQVRGCNYTTLSKFRGSFLSTMLQLATKTSPPPDSGPTGFGLGGKVRLLTKWSNPQMAFKKHWVITLKKLNSALADVRAELDKFGFWNPRLANIDVYLTWFGSAYGWQHYRRSRDIEITAFSLCRLCEAIPGSESVPLRDIVRHVVCARDCRWQSWTHAIQPISQGFRKAS